LQSPEVLDRIAKQIQSRYPDVTGNSLLGEIFSKDLVVQRLGATSPDPTRVLEITYRGKDPQKTQFILEELAKGYLRYSLDDRTSRIGGGIGFIEDQLPNLQQRVRSLEDQLQALKQRYRLLDPTVEGSSISKQLQDTRAQRVQTERELAEQQAAYNRLTGQLGLTPDEALAASSLSENPTYQSLIAQIKTLDAQIAIKSARYTEEGYPVASLLSQRKNLERLLEDETRRNLGQSFSGISQDSQIRTFQNETRLGLIKQLVDTAGTTQLLQIRREAVSKAEASLDQQLQEYPEIVRRYNDLQQQLDISTKTLNQFLTQRETLRIESAQKELPWEIISAPSIFKNAQGQAVPEDGGASKRMLTNLGIGLALGILAALLKEKIRNIFYSSLDVPDALNLPALSVVPFKKGSQQMSRSLPPNDPFAKAFGSLYTNLRFLTAQPVRSVVIGSAVAGEGKTLVALNLATTAAALGQRVLLVDANLRDPQLHTLFDLTHARGLTEVLTEDKMSWEEAIVPLEPNLSLLTAGQVSQNSAQLLASKEMQSVMHQMQSAFDLVIYDSPNMSEFSDTTFLAGQTEGVVMVVSVRKVKRSRVKQALAELKKFRLPVLGLVSNHPGKRANAVAAEKDPYENLYASKPALLGLNGLNSASPTPLPQSRDVVR
ncbi:MAG TPA: polysaccharide biosynthesis tyrosine autokinase, partial [Thermosynechococcaceae cyanobacterium]